MKTIYWVGDSRQVVKSYPQEVRKDIGTELMRVQHGLDPTDWKPMASVGAGVREILVQHRGQ